MIFKLFVLSVCIYASQCLTVEQAKSNPLQGYVLTTPDGQVMKDVGVRVGPLDLKYENQQSLQAYQFPQELVKKLEPYLGKSGNEASQLIQQKPLTLTQEELNTAKLKLFAFWAPKLMKARNLLAVDPNVTKSLFFIF